MKKSVAFLAALLLLALTACARPAGALRPGVYVAANEGESSVCLKADGTFWFNRHIAMSYLPIGTYSVEGTKLTLFVTEEETYLFEISGASALTFVSGPSAQSVVEPGTRFVYDKALSAECES